MNRSLRQVEPMSPQRSWQIAHARQTGNPYSGTLTSNARSSQMQAFNHMATEREQSRALDPHGTGAGARASADSEFRAPRTRPRQGTKLSILQTHLPQAPTHLPGQHRPGAGGWAQTEEQHEKNARPHVTHRYLEAFSRPWIKCNASNSRPGLTAPKPGRAHHTAAPAWGVGAHTSPIQATLLAPHTPTKLPPTGSSRAQETCTTCWQAGGQQVRHRSANPRPLLSHMLPSSHEPKQVGAYRAPMQVNTHTLPSRCKSPRLPSRAACCRGARAGLPPLTACLASQWTARHRHHRPEYGCARRHSRAAPAQHHYHIRSLSHYLAGAQQPLRHIASLLRHRGI